MIQTRCRLLDQTEEGIVIPPAGAAGYEEEIAGCTVCAGMIGEFVTVRKTQGWRVGGQMRWGVGGGMCRAGILVYLPCSSVVVTCFVLSYFLTSSLVLRQVCLSLGLYVQAPCWQDVRFHYRSQFVCGNLTNPCNSG